MKRDINDFVTIVRLKNGTVKITHNIQNEANIYKLLYELGYRKSKLNNKRIYFRRNGGIIIPTNFREIKYAFLELLREAEFTNIPDDLSGSEIINWYHERHPIKENDLFDHYLADTLTETEVLNFRLLTDHAFKHKFEVQQILLKLDEWKFDKTIDKASSICTNAPIYYKKIEANKFLVFIHYNSKYKTNDGFDNYIATFANVKHIGIKKPLAIEAISKSFNLEKDFEFIKDYIKY